MYKKKKQDAQEEAADKSRSKVADKISSYMSTTVFDNKSRYITEYFVIALAQSWSTSRIEEIYNSLLPIAGDGKITKKFVVGKLMIFFDGHSTHQYSITTS